MIERTITRSFKGFTGIIMLFMLIKRDAGYDFDVGENLE